MKTLFQGIITVILISVIAAQVGCGGGSDENSEAEQIREVEIQSLAAYNCMPADLRRELRKLEQRHDARVRALARASIPKGATGGTTPPAGFQQTVENDPTRKRFLRQARAIYQRYSPGGKDYRAACYLREREEARGQVGGS